MFPLLKPPPFFFLLHIFHLYTIYFYPFQYLFVFLEKINLHVPEFYYNLAST